jgi:hypothetical protein
MEIEILSQTMQCIFISIFSNQSVTIKIEKSINRIEEDFPSEKKKQFPISKHFSPDAVEWQNSGIFFSGNRIN